MWWPRMWWPRRRRSNEDELDEEILAHLAIEAKQRVEAGETPEQAEHSARREFGNVGTVKEVTRGMWGLLQGAHRFESLTQDLRYAGRGVRRTPGFAITAILILGLGIGANAVIFRMVDAALLRPLPFPESDRLVCIRSTENGMPVGSPSALDMRDFAAGARSFEGLVVYDHWRKNVSGILGSSQAEEMVVGLVPGNYFKLLRIQPIVGRLFSEGESVYGNHYVAIISSRFWQERFGGDSGILSKTLRINGETYSIVGVVPDVIPGWMDETTAPIRLWTPFASQNAWSEAGRGGRDNSSLARLKPGVSYEKAGVELATMAARLAQEHPVDQGIGAVLQPLADTRAGPVRPILIMLSAAVAMVLVIACANLASLLLARNSARSREMAVRAALGAGRPRLLRQLLLEALILALAGAVAGLGLASAAGLALARVNGSASLPYTSASNVLGQFSSAVPDLRIVLFALGVSLITAVLFGVAPAFTGTRVSLSDTLKEGSRSGAVGVGRQHFRRVLVIAEIALSLVLVCGAGLLTQTMARLLRQNPGFRPDHLLIAHMYVPPARYPDSDAISRFCDSFGRRVRGLPGVLDASVATGYPPTIGWQQMFTIPGQLVLRAADVPLTRFAGVDERYVKTLGFPILSGRDFAESDTPASQPVAIVNQEFVRQFFPNQDPLGRQIHPGPPPGVEAIPLQDFGSSSRNIMIVGVVRNFMNRGMALPPAPQIFTLFRQIPGANFGFKDVVVRTATDPASIVPALTRELKLLDADIPLGEIRSMETHLANQTADTRFTTVLLGLFAGLGTILAVIGAYGVVAYLVAQRRQEIGVRMALGASSRDILWLVLRNGLFMGFTGVSLGLMGAMAGSRFLARFLVGVSASDAPALFGAAALLLLVIAIASAIPARRAIQIDPVQTLRNE
jgi:putative ABC transport system permease protein